MRFYGFTHDEITAGDRSPQGDQMLDLDLDPKLAWALKNRGFFPVDLNHASREALLRVPGLGIKTVDRLIRMRRWNPVRLADLVALRAAVQRAMPFIVCADHRPPLLEPCSDSLRTRFQSPAAVQLPLAL